MFISEVSDPKGRHWIIKLHVIPTRNGIGLRERFRRKKKEDKDHWYDFLDPTAADDLWFAIAIIVFVVFMIFFGWPLILLLVDFIWLLLVLLGAVITYGVLGRPILITAICGGEKHVWKVRGIRHAIRQKDAIASTILRGDTLKS